MKRKNRTVALFWVGLFSVAVTSMSLALVPTRNSAQEPPVETVIGFWEAISAKDTERARAFRTDSWGGFRVNIPKSPPPEKWLIENGYEFVEAREHRRTDTRWVIAVDLLRKNRSAVTFYHEVVLTEKDQWKIIGVSF